MRNISEIYKREIRFYFTTPIAYVVMVIFSAVFGFLFVRNLSYYSQVSWQLMQNPYYGQRIDLIMGVFSPVFSSNSIIFLLVIPPISLRKGNRERSSCFLPTR